MIAVNSNFTLFSRIKYYKKMSAELQAHLSRKPDDWSTFQNIFNLSVDRVYQDIMEFERDNIKKSEALVYRLKQIFEKRYRQYFLYGRYIKWSYEKPFGYSGDFKIIDDIYLNKPETEGFDRLWDNYFQQLAAPESIRQRKEDFKRYIYSFVKKMVGKGIRIMNLASGSAREIKELLNSDERGLFSKVIFDCYDYDLSAIDYAKQLLNTHKNVNFYQKNAIRLALKKDITKEIPCTYNIIYSTGLFDYLDERVAVRLLSNLKQLLKKDGIIIISNASDKKNNSSASWMEWVADWYLIYRTQYEFQKIFVAGGFSKDNIQIELPSTKVMQYCIARGN